ncbi:AraC family transcriptional regulator [Niallia alba]
MVSEVGEMVGCKNVNTFIRIFKQYEGITPGKYVINKMAK